MSLRDILGIKPSEVIDAEVDEEPLIKEAKSALQRADAILDELQRRARRQPRKLRR